MVDLTFLDTNMTEFIRIMDAGKELILKLKMTTYKEEIIKAMNNLASYDDTIFIGQSVRWKGTGLYWTIEGIPERKKIELPVFEDVQMGMSIGLSLEGFVPVSIYPRMDFLVLAYNQ